jgi:5-methyltetrahydrofolate--homocysteine methyltransferase
MRANLRDRLQSGRPLLADGATGTQLQARGMAPGACSEAWCLERPDDVAGIAADYAAAGSDLVYTNSFGANPWRLKAHGLAERGEELNRAAAALARRGAGEDVWVVGSLGPSGDFLQPLGMLPADDVREAYGRQAAALVAGGADAVVLETFSALDEVTAAAEGALAAVDVPVMVSLTYGANGRTMMGVNPEQVVAALQPLGIAAIGLNCGDTLAVGPAVLRAYRAAAPALPLLAKLNAGMPVMTANGPTWPVSPAEFAAAALTWVAAGAVVVGGCCGTTPAHVAAIRAALD